ncbi:MAG: hypothetical protein NC299_08475 [Lachnospiraceae bacterium]|nr:hypothetical protein [Ruminococcus sp.]MCM1275387.1 hypothetical protein [Lachnospiraceae bacterium]
MNNIVKVFTISAVHYARMLSQMGDMGMMTFSDQMIPRLISFVNSPSQCPCCGKVLATDIIPTVAVNNIRDDKQKTYKVMAVYRCTSCGELFVTYNENIYEDNCVLIRDPFDDMYEDDERNVVVNDIYTYPFDKLRISFERDIEELSPMFVEIYHQAEVAEKQGLTLIHGMAYRRALEFLVRDYCVYLNPDKETEIDSKMLASKIDAYLKDDEDIWMLAQKAAWLGNDNTHVINKHPENTVDDMKSFIDILVAKIHARLVVDWAKKIPKK